MSSEIHLMLQQGITLGLLSRSITFQSSPSITILLNPSKTTLLTTHKATFASSKRGLLGSNCLVQADNNFSSSFMAITAIVVLYSLIAALNLTQFFGEGFQPFSLADFLGKLSYASLCSIYDLKIFLDKSVGELLMSSALVLFLSIQI